MRICLIIFLALFLHGCQNANQCSDLLLNKVNLKAVEQVRSGKRTIANAAWWGQRESNATKAIQAAINSGAKKVIIPNTGKDWIVEPILLASNQEIVFEPGVNVVAKKGEFKSKSSFLFKSIMGCNITLTGYGATIRMHKADYQSTEYEKSEWRNTISLYSCSNVKILGLTLKDSGGDGIYLGAMQRIQPYCKDIIIKDVVCDNHHRQGISIISAENLLIENCVFKNTRGTPPAAGIDFEPNKSWERMKNIVVRNCIIENNQGYGILAYLGNLTSKSEDVDIKVENCRIKGGDNRGIRISGLRDDGPRGIIKFSDCLIEDCNSEGLIVDAKSSTSARACFENCTWRNTARQEQSFPLHISLKNTSYTQRPGGIDFINCLVIDTKNRPCLVADGIIDETGIYDIGGNITVDNPHGAKVELGLKKQNVNLQVKLMETL